MSNTYDVKCVTCEERCYLYLTSWYDVPKLFAALGKIRQLADFAEAVEPLFSDYGYPGDPSGIDKLAFFLNDHRDHEFVVYEGNGGTTIDPNDPDLKKLTTSL